MLLIISVADKNHSSVKLPAIRLFVLNSIYRCVPVMYRIYRFMYGLVGFSRSQTNGFIIFLPLVVGLIFSEPLYRTWKASENQDFTSDVSKLDSLLAILEGRREMMAEFIPSDTLRLVRFDPNTATPEILLGIGFRGQLVKRIVNFRSKGGRFRVKKDLAKIYGLDSVQFALVEPYLSLPDRLPDHKPAYQRFKAPESKRLVRAAMDINSADSSSLKKVYGIGEKLALRILKYRDALGGFVSMEQLKEVYRLDTAVLKSLNRDFFVGADFKPAKVDLNSAGRQVLAAHPYLSSRAADAIVAYRFQHGGFTSIEDLRRIPAMDTTMLKKALPYLTIATP
jgi:competence protein ComEA